MSATIVAIGTCSSRSSCSLQREDAGRSDSPCVGESKRNPVLCKKDKTEAAPRLRRGPSGARSAAPKRKTARPAHLPGTTARPAHGAGDPKGPKSGNKHAGRSLPDSRREWTQEENVRGCIVSLFAALEVYGLKPRTEDPAVMRSFNKTVEHWLRGSNLVDPDYGWIKFAKYKFAAFIHAATAQADSSPPPPWKTPPPQKDAKHDWHDAPGTLACGSVGRWINSYILSPESPAPRPQPWLHSDWKLKDWLPPGEQHDPRTARQSFLATIGKVKSACPRPGLKFLTDSVVKTVKALSTEKRLPEPFMLTLSNGQQTPIHYLRVCEALRRTVRDVFEVKDRHQYPAGVPPAPAVYQQYEDRHRYKPISASTKSTYSHSQAKGGNMAVITQFIEDHALTREIRPLIAADIDDGEYIHNNTAQPVFAPLPPEDDHMFGCVMLPLYAPTYDCDLRHVEYSSMLLQDHLTVQLGDRFRTEPHNFVKPVALAEASKARIITVGDGWLTKYLHSMQKFMWNALQRHSCFVLTGSPVSATLVEDHIGSHCAPCPFECKEPCRHGEFFVSGDYSAATDNLAPWVSECIAEEIALCCGLTEVERRALLMSLTGNCLVTENKESKEKTLSPQKWGQLMGSIVSFPVLCLANAALTRLAIEIGTGRNLSLAQCRMLINGDDVCFRATFRTYKYWEAITGYGGLESSLGKTYVTREFVQINSRNYWYQEAPWYVVEERLTRGDDGEEELETSFRPYHLSDPGFVNFGLLMGMKRSEESKPVKSCGNGVSLHDIIDSDVTLGSKAEKLLECCPPLLRAEVYRRFISQHKPILQRVKVGWYVNTALGGAGLPILHNDPDAMQFRPSIVDRQVVARILRDKTPAGKPRYPVGPAPLATDWTTHKLVMDSIPEELLHYGQLTEEQTVQWSRIYGAVCFTQMFTKGALSKMMPSLTPEGKRTQSKKKKRSLDCLRANEKSWSRALRAGNLPKPVPMHALVSARPEKPYFQLSSIRSLYGPPSA